MRRVIGLLLVLGLLVSFSGVSQAAKKDKIAYVDFFKVFNDYSKTKEYDKKLEKEKSAVEKKLDAKKSEIEKIQNKLSLLKDEDKEKEQQKIVKEVQEYRTMERESMIDIKKERDEKMKEIVEDINGIVEDYAKTNGFSLIINRNAVLYGEKIMDVTGDILKLSNKTYKKK